MAGLKNEYGLYNIKTELVHGSEIRAGDTVIIFGEPTTIIQKYLHNKTGDIAIHGDIGGERNEDRTKFRFFTRVLFPKWYKGKILYHAPQI